MMGERTVMQEALFYEFSIERHVPADHLLRSIDRFVDLSGLRVAPAALLQRDRSALDRSGADDPDADRWLLLRHPLRAAAVRGSASEPRLSLVSLGGHGLSTPSFSIGQRRPDEFRLLCVLGTRWCRRTGWVEKDERPSSASRSIDECRTIATSDTGSSIPRTLPGALHRRDGGFRYRVVPRPRLSCALPSTASPLTNGIRCHRSTCDA